MDITDNQELEWQNDESKEKEDVNQSTSQQQLRGEVTEFVSNEQILWRGSTIYQNPPFKRVAEYLRNIDYQPERIRSPETLKRCTNYLIETILPLLHDQNYKKQETIQFISNRMRSIRSEYYVQSHTDIEVLQKMLRYECIASAYTNSISQIIVVAKTLYDKYREQPELSKIQYLKYIFIVCSFAKDFSETILVFDRTFSQFDCIQEYTRLCYSLKYEQFPYCLDYLRNCSSFFEACLIFPLLNNLRLNAIRAFAVSQLVFELDNLTDYLLMENAESTLDLLQSLGYDIKEKRQKTKKNQVVKISLKMKLKDMKEISNKQPVSIPRFIIEKLNGKSQREAVLQ